MKVEIRNIYIILISAILSVFGTLAARGSNLVSIIPIPYIYAVIMIVLIIVFYEKPFVIPYNKKFLVLVCICAGSAFVNSDKEMIISCICMLIIFSYLLKAPDNLRIYLLIGTALGQFVFLFRYGLTDSWNGNSVCMTFAFIMLISILSYMTNISDFILMIIIFIAGAIVIIMSSRTSMIAFFISVICLLIIRYRKTKSWPVKLTVLLTVLLVLIIRFRDRLSLVWVDKWSNRGYEGTSVLTGREDIWIGELKNDWTIWGNGKNYFNSIYHHNDAHNIFIQVLGRYGTLALIVFIIFSFSILVMAFKLKSDSKMYVLPTVIAYFIMGMFENVLFVDCKMYIPSMMFLTVVAKLICDKHLTEEDVKKGNAKMESSYRINKE